MWSTRFRQHPSVPLRSVQALALAGLWAGAAACQLATEGSPELRPEGDEKRLPGSLAPLPEWLSGTGLFVSGQPEALQGGVIAYSPQYPLWADGAALRRWLALPQGTTIDASDPDAWRFPAGTRLWQELRFGARVETRYMEALADGRFRYATYRWSADGRDARLWNGQAEAIPLPEGGLHDIPSESECRACHEGRPSAVLGLNALQLSPDRDPAAPHADRAPGDVDLPRLVRRGLLQGLPPSLMAQPPRIPARSGRERAALGYLFGNCASCHNDQGPLASLGLSFDQPTWPGRGGDAGVPLPSAIGQASGYPVPGQSDTRRIAPGRPDTSAVVHRMGTRFAAAQMPPLATHLVDEEALELIRQWIEHDLPQVDHGDER